MIMTIDWQEISAPPALDIGLTYALANLQSEWHFGRISDNSFIGYLNLIFDCLLIEQKGV